MKKALFLSIYLAATFLACSCLHAQSGVSASSSGVLGSGGSVDSNTTGTQTAGTANTNVRTDETGKIDSDFIPNDNDTVIKLNGTSTVPSGVSQGQIVVTTETSSDGSFADDSNVKLYLPVDSDEATSFTDFSQSNRSVTANGGIVGTSTAKFGDGGIALDGDGDYLSFSTSSDFDISGDFTVEGWAYVVDTPSNYALWGSDSGASDANNLQIVMVDGSRIDLLIANNAGDGWQINPGTSVNSPTITTGTWTHWAVSKTSNTVRLYWGGDQIRAGTTTESPANTGTLYVGARNNVSLGNYYNGALDEIIFTKGEAKYTNYTSTAPTSVEPANTAIENFTAYRFRYIDPVNGETIIDVETPGTSTTSRTVTRILGSRTAFGTGSAYDDSRVTVEGAVYATKGFKDDGTQLNVPDKRFEHNEYNGSKALTVSELKKTISILNHYPNLPDAEDTQGWSQLGYHERDMRILENVESNTVYIFQMYDAIKNIKKIILVLSLFVIVCFFVYLYMFYSKC